MFYSILGSRRRWLRCRPRCSVGCIFGNRIGKGNWCTILYPTCKFIAVIWVRCRSSQRRSACTCFSHRTLVLVKLTMITCVEDHRVSLGRTLCIEGDIILNRMLIKCRPSKVFIQIPTAECVFRLSFHLREHHRSTLSIVSCRIGLVCTCLIIPQLKCRSSKVVALNFNCTVNVVMLIIRNFIVSRNFKRCQNNVCNIRAFEFFNTKFLSNIFFICTKYCIPVTCFFT